MPLDPLSKRSSEDREYLAAGERNACKRRVGHMRPTQRWGYRCFANDEKEKEATYLNDKSEWGNVKDNAT